jgi:molybdopterin-guanine dinucleotide biosynthesis protein A
MFNIIILCAGKAERFNNKFKPLIYLDNRTFIEHCLENFIKYDDKIDNYFFIVTKEQEKNNKFRSFLLNKFDDIKHKINVDEIEKSTKGPYQTLRNFGKGNKYNYGNLIVCDCDHSINITPIIENYNKKLDVIIPIWNIKLEEHQNWGKILIEDNKIINFYEKEIVNKPGIYGMIGCYFFKDLNTLECNDTYIDISNFLRNNYQKINIKTVGIEKAYFFGTPEMVEKTIIKRRNLETIICDIDGVLLKHKSSSTDNLKDNIILGDCIKKIKDLSDNNMIILMSARPERTRKDLEKLLFSLKIKYHKLILGVNPGTRYIINDIKPSNIFRRQAISFNLERDKGLNDLIFKEYENNKIEVLKVFKGGSFSKAYLVKKDENLIVRKCIFKKLGEEIHYEKLKRQCDDMKRFYFYNELTPKILKEYDDDYHYYFDMEYLENYKTLDEFEEEKVKIVLNNLLNNLNNNVYCLKKRINLDNFWIDFLEEKIYSKLNIFEKESLIFNHLINSKYVLINDKEYLGLREVLRNIKLDNPKFISPIHGDLTLENIMHDGGEIKIIDMDGSKYLDSPCFDLGKLFQSIVSNFKEWKDDKKLIENKVFVKNIKCNNDNFKYDFENIKYLLEIFSNILEINLDETKKIGIFSMATYFIRFIPFMKKISENTAIYSLILSLVWLNNHCL